MPADYKLPRIVSQEEWRAARQATEEAEEKFAVERDAMVARWREMPMVEMDQDHVFHGPEGKISLIELFEGRSQLLIYHFWFQPGEEPCPGCSQWTYDLGDLGGKFANLHDEDTSMVFVSRATSAEVEDVKGRRNWAMPWYSVVSDDFDNATGYDSWAQISVLVRDGERAFLASVVAFDDLKTIGNHWTLLERTPFGVR